MSFEYGTSHMSFSHVSTSRWRAGGVRVVQVVLEDLEDVFKAPVLEAYAMTEASHQMTSNPLPSAGPHKASSVGKPTGIELGILNETGTVLGPNERGEVCIRGPNVTKGYRSNPTANQEAFAYGWFHTGDQVRSGTPSSGRATH